MPMGRIAAHPTALSASTGRWRKALAQVRLPIDIGVVERRLAEFNQLSPNKLDSCVEGRAHEVKIVLLQAFVIDLLLKREILDHCQQGW